jgi:16S rRNA (uracil1498-N3)-methyltransferase
LHQPVSFVSLFDNFPYQQKFIAHCIENEKQGLAALVNDDLNSKIILIGPEGDFTKEEVELAIQHHCIPVSLGTTRLRTETAALASVAILALR